MSEEEKVLTANAAEETDAEAERRRAAEAEARMAAEAEARMAAQEQCRREEAVRSMGSLAGGPVGFDPEGDCFRTAFQAALG